MCECPGCPSCASWHPGRGGVCGWNFGRKAADKERRRCRHCSDQLSDQLSKQAPPALALCAPLAPAAAGIAAGQAPQAPQASPPARPEWLAPPAAGRLETLIETLTIKVQNLTNQLDEVAIAVATLTKKLDHVTATLDVDNHSPNKLPPRRP